MTRIDLSVLQPYCENDMRLLKRISKSIFLKLGEPLTEADYDDFYSVANMTLWQAYNSYDPDKGAAFHTHLYNCLKRKFKTEIRDRHRNKRVINQQTISFDATDSSEERNLLDFIPSDFDTFEEVIKKEDKEQFQKKVQEYIARLSSQQENILNLLMDGYNARDIQKMLEISEKEYASHLKDMRSYEKVKTLF